MLLCNRPALVEADNQCPLKTTRLSLCNEIAALKISSTLFFPPKYSKSSSPCSTPFQRSGSDYIYPRKHEVLHGPVLEMLPRRYQNRHRLTRSGLLFCSERELPQKLAQRPNQSRSSKQDAQESTTRSWANYYLPFTLVSPFRRMTAQLVLPLHDIHVPL